MVLVFRWLLGLGADLNDLGGLGSFVTAFGTVYGVTIGFVVVEVWGQNIATQTLIDKEAKDIEALFELTQHFTDNPTVQDVVAKISDYLQAVLADRFEHLAQGERNRQAETMFQRIHDAIALISCDSDRDSIVFDHMLGQYLVLRATRTERISQGLNRLPLPISIFLYCASLLTIISFIFMPFANVWYSVFTVATLAFVIAFVHQIILDLDNPFAGYWNISPNLFELLTDRVSHFGT